MAQLIFLSGGGGGAGFSLPNQTVAANVALPTVPTVLLVDTVGGARTITLPDPATVANLFWYIKDANGAAESNPITLDNAAGGNIENAAGTRELRSNFGKWMLYCTGANWFFIA